MHNSLEVYKWHYFGGNFNQKGCIQRTSTVNELSVQCTGLDLLQDIPQICGIVRSDSHHQQFNPQTLPHHIAPPAWPVFVPMSALCGDQSMNTEWVIALHKFLKSSRYYKIIFHILRNSVRIFSICSLKIEQCFFCFLFHVSVMSNVSSSKFHNAEKKGEFNGLTAKSYSCPDSWALSMAVPHQNPLRDGSSLGWCEASHGFSSCPERFCLKEGRA